jgi:hypothetical protein
MNIGHSSRLSYDKDVYPDRLSESVGPLAYRLNTDQIYNCNSCLSTLGPRSAGAGRGQDVSKVLQTKVAPAQELVDVESILHNLNVKNSKAKSGKVNPIDVTKFKNIDMKICGNFLNPESTRLSHPSANYRDMRVNRFYNLPKDPQANIYWDNAANTSLEEKDNFVIRIPQLWENTNKIPVKANACGNNSNMVRCQGPITN